MYFKLSIKNKAGMKQGHHIQNEMGERVLTALVRKKKAATPGAVSLDTACLSKVTGVY